MRNLMWRVTAVALDVPLLMLSLLVEWRIRMRAAAGGTEGPARSPCPAAGLGSGADATPRIKRARPWVLPRPCHSKSQKLVKYFESQASSWTYIGFAFSAESVSTCRCR